MIFFIYIAERVDMLWRAHIETGRGQPRRSCAWVIVWGGGCDRAVREWGGLHLASLSEFPLLQQLASHTGCNTLYSWQSTSEGVMSGNEKHCVNDWLRTPDVDTWHHPCHHPCASLSLERMCRQSSCCHPLCCRCWAFIYGVCFFELLMFRWEWMNSTTTTLHKMIRMMIFGLRNK